MIFVIAFLLATVIVPIYLGKVRNAPAWLAANGLALAAAELVHGGLSTHALVAAGELIVLRVIVVPLILRHALRSRAGPDLDFMPSNLFVWAIAAGLLVVAFQFGASAQPAPHGVMLATVGLMVAASLIILGTNSSESAQLVAVLVAENAIALFEMLFVDPWPHAIHAGLSLVYVLTACVGAWLISVGTGRQDEAPRHD